MTGMWKETKEFTRNLNNLSLDFIICDGEIEVDIKPIEFLKEKFRNKTIL